MKRFFRGALALVLTVSTPIAALAQHGGSSGGGSHYSAPPPRAAAPPPRPAAPPPRPAQPGFSLPHDVAHPAPPVYPAHPGAPTAGRPMTPGRPIVPPPGHAVVRAPSALPPRYTAPAIRNPHNWNSWGWNHGRTWYPAPIYWGGGFWGPFALGALTGAFLYGSLVDYPDQIIYPSYQIQPLTPGAQLLQNYGLTQTPCGPPNLVIIWGPGDSVICAYPNDLVSAGNYQVDPTTLTLVSAPAQPASPPPPQ
jgi:hypothetical protein